MSLELDLEIAMKEAAAYHPRGALLKGEVSFAPQTAVEIWGLSITGIIKLVLDKALELGKEYRAQIEAAARIAVDAVVAFDLPWIPPSIENTLDEATRQAGYAAITAVLNAVLGA
jgi:hypothetical protein